jgi:hypothetical protein
MKNRLGFLTSVRLPDDPKIHDTFRDLEDLLQQEHGSDGKHPVASESQAGFISAEDLQKLNRMYAWFLKNMTGK